MENKDLQVITEKMEEVVDLAMAKHLKDTINPMVADQVKTMVETLRLQRNATGGRDVTNLDDDQKKNFVEIVKAVSFGKTKANEALIEEQDSRGGYLVPAEVAKAILRLAASVGVTMSQAQYWPMKSDELGIPSYRGSFLTGEYLGFDAAGSVTGLSFSSAKLIVKKWQLAFVVGEDLLADATPALADWLLALAAESLNNMIDKQAFIGTGAPFVGILNDPAVTPVVIATGHETFAEFDVTDASDVIASLEESLLDGAAFYFHRTVWAKIRMQKDAASNLILPLAGAVSNGVLENISKGGGVKPVGEILGFPVYTIRHLPANSETAVSTKFGVFGNMKAFAFGDKGVMSVSQFESGTFGGKEIALADQRALVLKHRHALVNALPSAFVTIKTAAS